MKKVLLSLMAVIAFSLTSNAQVGPQIGGHIGVPTGDYEEYYSLNLGVDVSYLWWVSDSFYAGLSSGYTTFLGDDDNDLGAEVENGDFIPVAATGNFLLNDNWLLGADVGYGIGLGDNEGGFYYQPKAGYSFNQNTNLTVGYKGISDESTLNAVTLGVRFGLTSY